jgi:hypothetical protein
MGTVSGHEGHVHVCVVRQRQPSTQTLLEHNKATNANAISRTFILAITKRKSLLTDECGGEAKPYKHNAREHLRSTKGDLPAQPPQRTARPKPRSAALKRCYQPERARQWQWRREGKGGQQHLEDAKEGLLKRQGSAGEGKGWRWCDEKGEGGSVDGEGKAMATAGRGEGGAAAPRRRKRGAAEEARISSGQ